MELAIAALNARLLAGDRLTSSVHRTAAGRLAGDERESPSLNITRVELPWTRNVGLKWRKFSTPRWNVRRSSGRHGSMARAMETPNYAGKSSDCSRTKHEPGAFWNERRLKT